MSDGLSLAKSRLPGSESLAHASSDKLGSCRWEHPLTASSGYEGAVGFSTILRKLRPDRLEIAVLILLTVAIAYQLFVDPVVGMANNADFARLIWPAGIGYKSSADYWDTVFRFSETKFVFVAPKPFRYMTSERPILGVALLLNRLLSKMGGSTSRSSDSAT